jgi:hypothetical protein
MEKPMSGSEIPIVQIDGHDHWDFGDRTLPVIRGGIDDGGEGANAPSTLSEASDAAMALESQPPATEEGGTGSGTEGDDDTDITNVDDLNTDDLGTDDNSDDGDDDTDEELEALINDDKVQQFERKYVEKLRAKEAELRVAVKPYKEAFSGFEPDDQEILLTMITELSTAPEVAAQKMVTLGNFMLYGEDGPPASTEGKDGDDDLDRPMTKRELQEHETKRQAEEQQRRDAQAQAEQQQRDVDKILADAKDLGYEPGTIDGQIFLGILAHQAGGDQAKAQKIMQDRDNRLIREYIKGKRTIASTGTASPQSGGQSAEVESHDPKDLDEAYEAAMARVRSQPGQ